MFLHLECIYLSILINNYINNKKIFLFLIKFDFQEEKKYYLFLIMLKLNYLDLFS